MKNIMPESLERIATLGMDLAKRVITLCGLDKHGEVIFRRSVAFTECYSWLSQLPKGCVVGMEACSSSNYWGQQVLALGLTARLMPAEFVIPFRQGRGNKNDHNDALAIAIAVRQPTMRFVSVKTVEQQIRLLTHTMREGYKAERTALINRVRGILLEFGFPMAQSATRFYQGVKQALAADTLPLVVREQVAELIAHLRAIEAQMRVCESRIERAAKSDHLCQRSQSIVGVGALTADAISVHLSHPKVFKNGRQFAAWLGLTPSQYSTGGKPKLGRITRRGDSYCRSLLVQGARSSLLQAERQEPGLRNREQRWMVALRARIGYQKALVAIANKHARQLWAMAVKGEHYDADAWRQYKQAA